MVDLKQIRIHWTQHYSSSQHRLSRERERHLKQTRSLHTPNPKHSKIEKYYVRTTQHAMTSCLPSKLAGEHVKRCQGPPELAQNGLAAPGGFGSPTDAAPLLGNSALPLSGELRGTQGTAEPRLV